ncbi:homoserine kinase [Flavisolibacter tropicus]|uniref:Homoserine kinase n=1 Tax=Flavisolibacter tropicus TaxID=1492898 RepID=A0A172TRF7_9BACT|nr:homoserine kinase [Flavisolibacter tropicus]ANE49464.1 serine kinase [Flavisolibacter tropicus]
MKTIKVKAPATIANLVCGFDVLGLCTEVPFDIMEVRLRDDREVIIKSADGYPLPTDPALNTAGAPLLEMIKKLDKDIGFDVIIQKNIKPGSGIGSSAASAAGAVVAANFLLNQPFTKDELVRLAMFGEKVASGVKHADNVAPCIYGGITLVRSIFPLDIIPITAPPLYVSIVHPQIEVRTADARQILRKEVLLKNAVKQWGNIAGLVAGLMKEDYGLISRSLEDVIIEPVRSVLIPGFVDVKKKCLQVGALGGGISGSGPSIFMLSADESTATLVAQEMEDVYQQLGIPAHIYKSNINCQGVTLFDETNDNHAVL